MSRLSEHHPHKTGTPQSVHAGFNRMSAAGAMAGWQNWRRGLSGGERGAIAAYRTDSTEINAKLRGFRRQSAVFIGSGEVTLGSTEGDIELIKGALAKSRAPSNLIVYRGITDDAFVGGPAGAVGRTIRDKGFTSTTINRDVAVGDYAKNFDTKAPRSGTVMEIKVVKGAQAGYIEGVGGLEDFEVLLPPSSPIRITGHRAEGGLDILEAEYVS